MFDKLRIYQVSKTFSFKSLALTGTPVQIRNLGQKCPTGSLHNKLFWLGKLVPGNERLHGFLLSLPFFKLAKPRALGCRIPFTDP